jgi:hypothetical protein
MVRREGEGILLGKESEYDLPYARLEGMVRILFSPTHMSRRPVCSGDRDRELSCKEGKVSNRKFCMCIEESRGGAYLAPIPGSLDLYRLYKKNRYRRVEPESVKQDQEEPTMAYW